MKSDKKLKERLKCGDVVFGPWCVIPSAEVMEITASAGFDFVIIDLEHGPASFATAQAMAMAAKAGGARPIIRLGNVDEVSILKSLDIGVDGIITAHVETAEDARSAVSHSKYHPIGARGFSPFTRAGNWDGGNIARHAESANEATLLGVILEGKVGIDNLEEIIEVPSLDLVYIGAYDLSQALGMPGDVGHPEVRQAMEHCVKTLRNAGISAGGYVARSEDDIAWMIDIGMQFITYLPDCTAIRKAFSTAVQSFRTIVDVEEGK